MSSSCCSTARTTANGASATRSATRPSQNATGASPCCDDPRPNEATGACCGGPAPSCGCQSGRSGQASRLETSAPATSVLASATGPPLARRTRLPVAVIGAGPIGLAAAAHLREKGETPLVFEAGPSVGASIREWGHVRLFSPWKYLVDPAARRLLDAVAWRMPDEDRLPTGSELVEQFLEPLAAHPSLAPHIRYGHRVVAVSRRSFDKVKTAGRDEAPFDLAVRISDGRRERVLTRAVIDASGTWYAANPLGASGLVAEGETEHSHRIRYGIPDVRGRERGRYAGKRTLVVGSGHSAFSSLLDLAVLADEVPGPAITWAIRRTDVGLLFGGGSNDQLEARGALGTRMQALVEQGRVHLVNGFRAAQVHRYAEALAIEGDDGRTLGPVDEIVVATGFRPDLTLARELRLELDPWLEAPVRLAPLIDPNLHSCGTVYPHGAAELSHPEKNFYVVGMKSYGRAPTFLMLTGYEQVRSVACALVGDEEGARNVELTLPETGVCQTDLGGALGDACCSTVEEPALVSLSPAGR